MFHSNRTNFRTDGKKYTPKELADLFEKMPGQCLCQAFILEVNGRVLYLLNDSISSTSETYHQEYAVVEKLTEQGLCQFIGKQLESVTITCSYRDRLKMFETLDKSDYSHVYGQVQVTVEPGDSHKCGHCE